MSGSGVVDKSMIVVFGCKSKLIKKVVSPAGIEPATVRSPRGPGFEPGSCLYSRTLYQLSYRELLLSRSAQTQTENALAFSESAHLTLSGRPHHHHQVPDTCRRVGRLRPVPTMMATGPRRRLASAFVVATCRRKKAATTS